MSPEPAPNLAADGGRPQRPAWVHLLTLTALYALLHGAVALSVPRFEPATHNDDWVYVPPVERLYESGRLELHPIAAALALPQIVAGAAPTNLPMREPRIIRTKPRRSFGAATTKSYRLASHAYTTACSNGPLARNSRTSPCTIFCHSSRVESGACTNRSALNANFSANNATVRCATRCCPPSK